MAIDIALSPAGIEEDAEDASSGAGGEGVRLPLPPPPDPDAAAGGEGTAKSGPKGCFGCMLRVKFVSGNCRDVRGDICDISDRSCCCF